MIEVEAIVARFTGRIPAIVRNDDDLYADLRHYFKMFFIMAQNLSHPYHNYKHGGYMLYQCYQACLFYKNRLSRVDMRSLLIAGLYHDYDHCGMRGHDDLNIERAVRGVEAYILDEDRVILPRTSALIRTTQYPYVVEAKDLDLCGKILRDVDVSQGLNSEWVQPVIFGLAREWGDHTI
jgi:hypothetical protein